MKELIINRNSFWYKLAKIGSYSEHDWDADNFCSFTWSVILGVFLGTLIVCLGSFLTLMPVGNLIAWLAFIAMHGYIEPNLWLVGFGIAYGILGVTILFLVGLEELRDWRDHRRDLKRQAYWKVVNQEASHGEIVKSAYQSWKDKTCVRVSFTNGDGQ